MNWLQALILGIIQGLTEFLPISSDGHLELGKAVLGIKESGLTFTIVVHGATVLSTIVIFRKTIYNILKAFFKFKWNEETRYIFMILFSMLPVGIVGVFFKEEVEGFFNGDIKFVGLMLIITAVLLGITFFVKSKEKNITFFRAFIIGIAQAIAVLPGVSRSASTISTGIFLGTKKEEIVKFSFLMVLIPILCEIFLGLFKGEYTNQASIGVMPLIIGFIAAFISGLFACKWMLNIVKKGKLIYFAIYCLIIGIIAIMAG